MPFKNIYYQEVKSIDDDPCIVLNEFVHNRINYEVNVFYDNNDDLPYPYEIKFTKSKGDNSQDKYGEDVKQVLKDIEYEWNDEYKGYFFSCKDIDTLIKKLKETTEKLKNGKTMKQIEDEALEKS